MQLDKILVALKPWERALPLAVTQAQRLTRGTGAQLRLMTTVFESAVASGIDRGDSKALASQKRIMAAARVELERLASALRSGSGPVLTRTVWGIPPYDAIADAARDWPADLLVVGAHEPQTQHARLTDTDWQLMRRVSCPLLLIKRGTFGGYEKIVAALDGFRDLRAGDDAVMAAGRSFARAFDSTLSVVELAGAAELGRVIEGRPCLLVVRAAPDAALGGHLMVHALVNAAPCDVLLVPAAVDVSELAIGRLQVG
jgi:nucleotide-binding universal stress UspA family protein